MIATTPPRVGIVCLVMALVTGCGPGSARHDAGDAAAIVDAKDAGHNRADSMEDAMPDRGSQGDGNVAADSSSDDLAISDVGTDIGADVQGDATSTDLVSDAASGAGGAGGDGSLGQGGNGGGARGGTNGIASGGVGGGTFGGHGGGAGGAGGTASGGTGGASGGSTGGASGGTAGNASGGTAGTASGGSAGGPTGGSGGASSVAGTAAASLYLITAANATLPSVLVATDLTLLDTIKGRAIRQVPLLGTSAIAYRAGSLLAAQGSGYTRITSLDPDTLATVRVQTLAWDPEHAVFSTDGHYMYAAHGDGYVAQVRLSDGKVTSEIRVPAPPGGMEPSDVSGLAIDPTETFLGTTSIHAGTGSSVALIRISGQTLTLIYNWLSQPFSSSNCSRFGEYPAFDRASTRLVSSDRNCNAFDVYSLSTGLLDSAASVTFERDQGISAYSTTVVDSRGQIWATNYDSIYRASITDPTRQKKIPFGPESGGLAIDSTGEIIYAFQNDPRTNGIFRLDATTGTLTRQAWNLDLLPLGSLVVTSALVDRTPPAN